MGLRYDIDLQMNVQDARASIAILKGEISNLKKLVSKDELKLGAVDANTSFNNLRKGFDTAFKAIQKEAAVASSQIEKNIQVKNLDRIMQQWAAAKSTAIDKYGEYAGERFYQKRVDAANQLKASLNGAAAAAEKLAAAEAKAVAQAHNRVQDKAAANIMGSNIGYANYRETSVNSTQKLLAENAAYDRKLRAQQERSSDLVAARIMQSDLNLYTRRIALNEKEKQKKLADIEELRRKTEQAAKANAAKSTGDGGIMSNFMKRLGIATDFSIAYKALQAIYAAMRKVKDTVIEVVSSFDELAATQAKLAMWATIITQGQISYGEAFVRAGVNMRAFNMAAVGALSSTKDLSTAIDEFAQQGLIFGPEMQKEMVHFADFVLMVAQTTGNSARQVRQEVQAIFSGNIRPENQVLRTMKNFGMLSPADIKNLKAGAIDPELIRSIISKISTQMEPVYDAMFGSSLEASTKRFSNSFIASYVEAIMAASEKAGNQNVFAVSVNKLYKEWQDSANDYESQQARVKAIENLASAFELLAKGIMLCVDGVEKLFGLFGFLTEFNNQLKVLSAIQANAAKQYADDMEAAQKAKEKTATKDEYGKVNKDRLTWEEVKAYGAYAKETFNYFASLFSKDNYEWRKVENTIGDGFKSAITTGIEKGIKESMTDTDKKISASNMIFGKKLAGSNPFAIPEFDFTQGTAFGAKNQNFFGVKAPQLGLEAIAERKPVVKEKTDTTLESAIQRMVALKQHITEFAEGLKEPAFSAAKTLRRMFDDIDAATGKKPRQEYKITQDTLTKMKAEAQQLASSATLAAANTALDKSQEELNRVNEEGIGITAKQARTYNELYQEISTSLKGFVEKNDIPNETLEVIEKRIAELKKLLGQVREVNYAAIRERLAGYKDPSIAKFQEQLKAIDSKYKQDLIEAQGTPLEEELKAQKEREKRLVKIAQEGKWEAVKYGTAQGIDSYAAKINNTFENVKEAAARAMQSVEDSIVDAFEKGEFGASQFFQMIQHELIKLAVQRTIMQPMMGFMRAFLPDWFAPAKHGGGDIGTTHGGTRSVNPMVFANAPRFHNGLRSDEFPAILQSGESVTRRGGETPTQTIVIENHTGQQVQKQEKQGSNGSRELRFIIGDTIKQVLSSGQLDTTFKQTFGLKRVGVA